MVIHALIHKLSKWIMANPQHQRHVGWNSVSMKAITMTATGLVRSKSVHGDLMMIQFIDVTLFARPRKQDAKLVWLYAFIWRRRVLHLSERPRIMIHIHQGIPKRLDTCQQEKGYLNAFLQRQPDMILVIKPYHFTSSCSTLSAYTLCCQCVIPSKYMTTFSPFCLQRNTPRPPSTNKTMLYVVPNTTPEGCCHASSFYTLLLSLSCLLWFNILPTRGQVTMSIMVLSPLYYTSWSPYSLTAFRFVVILLHYHDIWL